MAYIVITREGWGDVLLFEGEQSASLHPVVDPYVDAMLANPDDVWDVYNQLEWGRLARLAGVPFGPATEDQLAGLSGIEERAFRRDMSPSIWARLLVLAVPPPEDLEGILAMVARNRTMMKRTTRVTVEASTDAAKSEPTVKGTGDLAADTKIKFAKDKDGKAYGPDNNPHAADSNRGMRFAKLKNNMTVQQAVDAGVSPRQIKDIADRKHITLHPKGGAPAPAAEAQEDEAAE